MKKLFLFGILLTLILIANTSAQPGATLTCGQTITTNTVMDNDITCAGGAGLDIGVDGITLDCNGHIINITTTAYFSYGVRVYGKNNVIVKNCRIYGADMGISIGETSDYSPGTTSNNNQIINVTIAGGTNAIYLQARNRQSSNNKIINSTLSGYNGILVDAQAGSTGNQIIGSLINNTYLGVQFGYSRSNQIINSIINNTVYGVNVYISNYHQIINSAVSGSDTGISFNQGDNNEIINSTGICTSSQCSGGIWIYVDHNAKVINSNGIGSSTGKGIYLERSSNAQIINSSARGYNGIYLQSSSNNQIYNNLINSTTPVSFGGTVYYNVWNSSIGGNYWANPSGTGFSQTCTDSNSDGICDQQYSLASNNTDYLPLAILPFATKPICGNSIKEIGEQCDDGNTISGDGCSSTCTTECNAPITLTSNTVLTRDYNFCNNGFTIGAKNIVLDCNGHSIIGSGIGITNTGFNNITIKNCNIQFFIFGIYIHSSLDNQIINSIVDSSGSGILIIESYRNIIINTTAISAGLGTDCIMCGRAIYLQVSAYNIIINSTMIETSSNGAGISLYPSIYNTIYNNIINATNPADIVNSYYWNLPSRYNAWNNSFGGNYWATPSGTGFSQICNDANSDGICDSSYIRTSEDIDYLPLAILPFATKPICGNNIKEIGEQCDDGNLVNGDCCSSTCQYEPAGSQTCGVGACQVTVANCNNGVPISCVPGTPTTEICDNIDNDCDGNIDQGVKTTFYQDSDSDAYGNALVSQDACSQPEGYVTDNTDCDDNNANINPSATETCNGIDDDCDGQIDEGGVCPTIVYYCDRDTDGYKSSEISGSCNTYNCIPSGCTSMQGNDCDDFNVGINPGADDSNCNGINEDCDEIADDDYVLTPTTCGVDLCANTGILECINGLSRDTCVEAPKVIVYRDADGDEFGSSSGSEKVCTILEGYILQNEDCNDNDASVNPLGIDICDIGSNVINKDCNPDNDAELNCQEYCGDTDKDGYVTDEKWGEWNGFFSIIICPWIKDKGDCNDFDATINPEAVEVCDSKDNDCNGVIDDSKLDSDSDGVFDCQDKCSGTIKDIGIDLKPNNYADIDGDRIFEWNAGSSSKPKIIDSQVTLKDTYGCSCNQILMCKSGNNEGELKFGCTGGPNGLGKQGTVNLWITKGGWATDCK